MDKLIITFCGHSSFDKRAKDYGLYELLCNSINGRPVEFYLGGYGKFDEYALLTAIEYRKKHDNAKICFITPYLDKGYSKISLYKDVVDGIIFPELESVPKKFAIVKRNEWMVKKADIIFAYVKYSWGGARTTFEYAKRQRKKIINLAE